MTHYIRKVISIRYYLSLTNNLTIVAVRALSVNHDNYTFVMFSTLQMQCNNPCYYTGKGITDNPNKYLTQTQQLQPLYP